MGVGEGRGRERLLLLLLLSRRCGHDDRRRSHSRRRCRCGHDHRGREKCDQRASRRRIGGGCDGARGQVHKRPTGNLRPQQVSEVARRCLAGQEVGAAMGAAGMRAETVAIAF